MRVSFIGDVSFTGNFGKALVEPQMRGDILSKEVQDIFDNSDATVCNIEGPVTNEECIRSTKLNVKSHPDTIPFLVKKNIKYFGLANNHMFDAQYQGFFDTKKSIQEHGGTHFGAGDDIEEASTVCYVQKDDVKVALIGVGHNIYEVAGNKSPGIFSYVQKDILEQRINQAKEVADWVVVYCHAGPEYNFYPTPVVRALMGGMITMGADVIIGHHPHTMQGFEYVEENKLIVYSLGNFIFDLVTSRNKRDFNIGLISTLIFSKTSFRLENFPVLIDPINSKISLASKSLDKKLVELSNFKGYNKKMFKESLRCVFMNPLLPSGFNLKSIIFFLLYPFAALYKFYLIKGYDREYVDIILDKLKLNFLKKLLRHDVFYKSN